LAFRSEEPKPLPATSEDDKEKIQLITDKGKVITSKEQAI